MKTLDPYAITKEDLTFLSRAADIEIRIEIGEDDKPGSDDCRAGERSTFASTDPASFEQLSGNEQALSHIENVESFDSATIIKEMVSTLFDRGNDAFTDYVQGNLSVIRNAAQLNEDLPAALIVCYKIAISQGHAQSANNLGAMYYLGDMVEQDYAKAADLYELAMEGGCMQGIINLAYIYEYGRQGKPDLNKAFQLYSFAAALDQNYEALYKLGDMYSRGKVLGKDVKKAYALWTRSLKVAVGIEEISQPAIRIASLLVDAELEQRGVEFNPLRALHLYQEAEIGLRISIDKGYGYYSKRLQEAIDGQQKARELLDLKYLD